MQPQLPVSSNINTDTNQLDDVQHLSVSHTHPVTVITVEFKSYLTLALIKVYYFNSICVNLRLAVSLAILK